jgi:hypothetical protein
MIVDLADFVLTGCQQAQLPVWLPSGAGVDSAASFPGPLLGLYRCWTRL